MNHFFETVYFQNTIRDYLISIAIVLVGLILIRIFKKILFVRLKRWSERTENHLDDFIVNAIDRFGIPALYFIVLYIGINYLTLSQKCEKVVKIATTIVLTFLAIRLLSSVILTLLRSFITRQNGGDEKVKQVGGIMIIVNIIVWTIGMLFLFDNMGYNVTTLITGLGIGGIAIALAAQNILGDLFNYFVIFFDRPFEVGDFIIIEDKMGEVEYIGIKTTRLKSLSGEQIIVANSDLTRSRIHNYKRMEQRRVSFSIGVVYSTTPEQIKDIPLILKAAVEKQDNVQFDRAHFKSFADSSLVFEVVYFVLSSQFNIYMDIQQAINVYIYEVFKEQGIDFAFPTQTLFLKKEEA